MGIGDRLQHAWNALSGSDAVESWASSWGASFDSRPPQRTRPRSSNERSIIAAIYNRIAVDASGVEVRHIQLDAEGRLEGERDSGLNNCLRVEANKDQAARAFRQDYVLSLFEEGVIAIVPVDTTLDPRATGSYDIQSLRIGKVVKWMADQVKVDLYNDRTGKRQQVVLDKSFVGIVENPFYSVMNEPNSTLQRLIHKLNLLDTIDEQSGSGKLDLIIQLPYVVKSDTRKLQAEQRRKDLESQLRNNKYGIGYTDGTEKITQLNRPTENNLLKQVEYLMDMLYGELGITREVMNGTADEKTMLNYHTRTLEPLLDAFAEELRRKFLTKTARTQGQWIDYFRNPFKFVPLAQLGEVVNNLSRNEVATANELRPLFGLKPHADAKADQLNNSNINPNTQAPSGPAIPQNPTQEGDSQNES